MRKLILTLAVLSLLFLSSCHFSFFDYTGEEDLLPQIRGMGQLAADALRPQPRVALDAPVAHAGVNPFGINVFLEQEVEPEKRERAVQMIAEAGFHWLRQEFPWEDIEIHGKDDFEDRRHEPHRSAWDKYDHIVEPGRAVWTGDRPALEQPSRLDPRRRRRRMAPTLPPTTWPTGAITSTPSSPATGDGCATINCGTSPTSTQNGASSPVDPEGYTQLLCEGYRRAKEADPEAVIVSGALAPTDRA